MSILNRLLIVAMLLDIIGVILILTFDRVSSFITGIPIIIATVVTIYAIWVFIKPALRYRER